MSLLSNILKKKSEQNIVELENKIVVADKRLQDDEKAVKMLLKLVKDEEVEVLVAVGNQALRILQLDEKSEISDESSEEDNKKKKKKKDNKKKDNKKEASKIERTVRIREMSEFHVNPNVDDRSRDQFKFVYRPDRNHPGSEFVFYGEGANWILNAINDAIKEILAAKQVKNPEKVLKESGLTPRGKSNPSLLGLLKAASTPREGGSPSALRKAGSTTSRKEGSSPSTARKEGSSPSSARKEDNNSPTKTSSTKLPKKSSEKESEKDDEKEIKASPKSSPKSPKKSEKEKEKEQEKEAIKASPKAAKKVTKKDTPTKLEAISSDSVSVQPLDKSDSNKKGGKKVTEKKEEVKPKKKESSEEEKSSSKESDDDSDKNSSQKDSTKDGEDDDNEDSS